MGRPVIPCSSDLCPAPSSPCPQRYSHTCAQTNLVLPGVGNWILGPPSGTREEGRAPSEPLALEEELPFPRSHFSHVHSSAARCSVMGLSWGQLLPSHLSARAEPRALSVQSESPVQSVIPQVSFPRAPLVCRTSALGPEMDRGPFLLGPEGLMGEGDSTTACAPPRRLMEMQTRRPLPRRIESKPAYRLHFPVM